MQDITTLVRANLAFKNRDFDGAMALYKEALEHAENPLKSQIKFNYKLVLHRLGYIDQSGEVAKPDGLDGYCFDLIRESGLFDPIWYLEQYREKFGINENPLAHYLAQGVEVSTNPSPEFDTVYYLRSNQDVAEAGIHPLIHYVTQGHKENRAPKPQYADNELDIYRVESAQYIPRIDPSSALPQKAARVIAFYLPQFHPIPENDKWWGEGFTEWTNVRPAKPQFEGHYQPHVPDEFLGYYDLRDTSVMRKQIELAKQYGVEGFCFYAYWFSGHRLLETPLDNYLADSTLDLPFCVCWANENWSRRWDGLDQDLLMMQNYSEHDDIAFIAHMSKYLCDPRYIKVEGKPLLIIYRPNLFPSMKETAERWRTWCRTNGLGEIYLAYAQSFESIDPAAYGLDAAIEFSPNNSRPKDITSTISNNSSDFTGKVYDWRTFLKRSEQYTQESYTLFRGVCPSWDNVARKKGKGIVFANSSPALFESLLTNVFREVTSRTKDFDKRLIFVNAWNEWAEGAHLEPDKRFGYAWLDALRGAHNTLHEIINSRVGIVVHVFYTDVFVEICEMLSMWSILKNVELVITTIKENYSEVKNILSNSPLKYSIFINENRGRDVYPFVKCLDMGVLTKFNFLIKVHTKKSLHRNDGDKWRKIIFDSLLTESNAIKYFEKILKDERIGLVAPKGQCVPFDYYWGSNQEKVEKMLSSRFGDIGLDYDNMKFVAGTMFIASRRFVCSMKRFKMSDEIFEDELGQIDGTTAHAIERIIGALVYIDNLDIYENSSNDFAFADRA